MIVRRLNKRKSVVEKRGTIVQDEGEGKHVRHQEKGRLQDT